MIDCCQGTRLNDSGTRRHQNQYHRRQSARLCYQFQLCSSVHRYTKPPWRALCRAHQFSLGTHRWPIRLRHNLRGLQANTGGQLQIDSAFLYLNMVVIKACTELFLTGYFFSHVELPADLICLIKQADPVTTSGGDRCKGQACRTCTLRRRWLLFLQLADSSVLFRGRRVD